MKHFAEFLFLVLAIFVGGFLALAVWSLIVKNALSQQLDSASNSPLLSLLAGAKG